MNSEKMTRKSKFICVEIAIKTDFDSDEFIRFFEEQDNFVQKHPSENHKWYIYFDPTPYKDANMTILKLCEVISNLPTEVRTEWDKAAHREFFAGYEVGEEPHCFAEHIELKTIQACINIGACIGYALYPASATDKDGYPEDLLSHPKTNS